jgi:hypothetical protein
MKLLEQFAAATEACYRDWIVDFLQFHRQPDRTWVHPAVLREPGWKPI